MSTERDRPTVEVTRLEPFRDERGIAYEPISPEELAGQRNVHVVVTRPGHVRGNHLHYRETEILVVHGPALARWRVDGEVTDVELGDGEIVAFRFPPGIPHAILNTGDAPNVIVAFKDRPYEPEDPDVERVALIEGEPDRTGN